MQITLSLQVLIIRIQAIKRDIACAAGFFIVKNTFLFVFLYFCRIILVDINEFMFFKG